MMSGNTPLSYILRGYYVRRIMSFRDEPETGDFYAQYYLLPLLSLHGDTLAHLSDEQLRVEHSRAPIISGLLAMGLLDRGRFRKVAEMSVAELESYRAYAAHTCEQLVAMDPDNPPEWLAWLR